MSSHDLGVRLALAVLVAAGEVGGEESRQLLVAFEVAEAVRPSVLAWAMPVNAGAAKSHAKTSATDRRTGK